MKSYKATITATITKDVLVEAENEDDAIELAHETFDVSCDGVNEKYNETTDSCREVA